MVKTSYIYSLRSRLVNVRLGEGHRRKASQLREHGVVLSDLVRDAIDRKFDELQHPGKAPISRF